MRNLQGKIANNNASESGHFGHKLVRPEERKLINVDGWYQNSGAEQST